MKYTLEIPDEEAAFITEVIRRLLPAQKLTPFTGDEEDDEDDEDVIPSGDKR